MAASFGVHFGSTSACLAVCKDGKADVIANDTGDRTTPAVVSYTDHDQGIGLAAKQGMIRNASNTICHVKSYLGRTFDDPGVQELVKSSSARVVQKDGRPVFSVMYKEKGINVTPIHVATAIYKKMMVTAESHGGLADSHDAVITVPLQYSQSQKEAAREAATKAGFRVLRVMSEPAAALLAYDLGQGSKDASSTTNVLVYRLGGTSLDTTVMTVSNGLYRVVASNEDKTIGGRLIEDLLIDYFAVEFKRQWKNDCRENKRSVMKLRNASESCKHILSRMPTTQCSVESLYDGIDFQGTLSRGRLEALCGSFLQKCLGSLQDTLDKARVVKDDIHKVIICGGTTKIPSLQQQLQDYFPQAELLSSIPPDEVIAVGASKQAAILSSLDESMIQRSSTETSIPCLPVDLLIKSEEEGGFTTVMPRHTPVPAKSQQDIQLGDEQDSICVLVYSRSSPSDEPMHLAKIVLRELPNGSKVNAVFHIKGDGHVSVTCSEPTTNKSAHVLIESS